MYANSNPVSYVDPSGLFSLAEVSAARKIRNTLAEAQFSSYTELIRNTDSDGAGGQISGFIDKILFVKDVAELSFSAIPFLAANLPVLNVKKATKTLKLAIKSGKGANIKVKTRNEAAELLRETIQGKGYRNSTGFTGNQVQQNSELFPKGKKGTYHWDYADTEHGGVPHLQIHDFDGNITRIFFEEGAGLPISQRHW